MARGACLSKGLASPAGSLVLGGAELVARARRVRKALGGGMRQAGVLAACGLVSLERMARPSRLREDHRRARELARGLASIDGLEVPRPDSNMVLATVVAEGVASADLVAALGARGTRVVFLPPLRSRAGEDPRRPALPGRRRRRPEGGGRLRGRDAEPPGRQRAGGVRAPEGAVSTRWPAACS
ncbi:unnamed protein product, partial [Prorocentrum cordatum]